MNLIDFFYSSGTCSAMRRVFNRNVIESITYSDVFCRYPTRRAIWEHAMNPRIRKDLENDPCVIDYAIYGRSW